MGLAFRVYEDLIMGLGYMGILLYSQPFSIYLRGAIVGREGSTLRLPAACRCWREDVLKPERRKPPNPKP